MTAKKIASFILTASLLSSALLCGCGGNNTTNETTSTTTGDSNVSDTTDNSGLPEDGGFTTVSYEPSTDKYRTYYEIFPYSFCDSNGDGIGDLNGITEKLDYLNDGDTSTTDDLGIEGIWLMPIMPSPSYHKYNVKDYKDIDPSYGTLEDFQKLIDEAHKRNINVIIDFVINHTSRQHEWFKQAKKEIKAGKTDGYAQYYHFAKNKNESGWRGLGFDDWYYEAQFDDDMPDLNLRNDTVRKEIEDAAKFWLDMGVDGFRLDAVKWYEYPDNEGSIKDLKWFYDYVESVNKDAFVVGECWDNSVLITDFYKSGADSFFDFDEQGPQGRVASAVNKENAADYVKSIAGWQKTIQEVNPNAINTPFISNHDTARSAGFFSTDSARKMAAAMYILSPGNAFIYYGEEIGMTGSESDPDKRTGMYWSAEDKKGYVESIPGASDTDVPDQAVDKQEKDENSLLNFYKRVIALKNQNPEIEKGNVTAVTFGDDVKKTAGYVFDSDGSKVFVLFNAGTSGAKVTVPESDFKINEVRGYAIAGEKADETSTAASDDMFAVTTSKTDENAVEADEFIVDGQEITLPAQSVIVLK
ncbi:MAG: alpha-amylase [Clostridia bacterium]|nr:alpha-amylase [Clostridia bacterium]